MKDPHLLFCIFPRNFHTLFLVIYAWFFKASQNHTSCCFMTFSPFKRGGNHIWIFVPKCLKLLLCHFLLLSNKCVDVYLDRQKEEEQKDYKIALRGCVSCDWALNANWKLLDNHWTRITRAGLNHRASKSDSSWTNEFLCHQTLGQPDPFLSYDHLPRSLDNTVLWFN